MYSGALCRGFLSIPVTSPESFLILAQAVKDPNTSITQVADIVGRDVAMSAKVLQLVNSAFFGLAQKVTNVQTRPHIWERKPSKSGSGFRSLQSFSANSRIPQTVHESMQRHAQRTAAIAGTLPVDRKTATLPSWPPCFTILGACSWPAKCRQVLLRTSIAKARDANFLKLKRNSSEPQHAEIGAYLLDCGVSRPCR